MAAHSTEDLPIWERIELMEARMATLTDVVAALAAKIDELKTAYDAKEAQTGSDLGSLIEQADALLQQVRGDTSGTTGETAQTGSVWTDHTMGDANTTPVPESDGPQIF